MPHRRLQRGSTLLEAMVAMAVLLTGAAGLVGLQRQTNFLMSDARQATRAAAFAQDLAAQIELWEYTDPRLSNTNLTNDADPTSGLEMACPAVAPDHADGDKEPDAQHKWTGLPTQQLTDAGMERYWSVSYGDDGNANAIPDAVRVTVIVRWHPNSVGAVVCPPDATHPNFGGWRYTTFMVVKPNPADYL
jgi:Tfp pilus assembly protein PilV